MSAMRAIGSLFLLLAVPTWAGPATPPMPPAVVRFLSGEARPTPAALNLGIRSTNDMIRYFELHRKRLKILLQESEGDWQELASILGIPGELRNEARLREVAFGLIKLHDQAKMNPEVSKGLLKIFGRNISALPEQSPEKQFVRWFNSWDDEFGRDYFRAHSVPLGVRDFSLYLEKMVDIEDRIRSPEAEIEFARPRGIVSERGSSYLEPLLARIEAHSPHSPGTRDRLIAFFRKTTDRLSAVYDPKTAPLHFRALNADSPSLTPCTGAALKKVLALPPGDY